MEKNTLLKLWWLISTISQHFLTFFWAFEIRISPNYVESWSRLLILSLKRQWDHCFWDIDWSKNVCFFPLRTIGNCLSFFRFLFKPFFEVYLPWKMEVKIRTIPWKICYQTFSRCYKCDSQPGYHGTRGCLELMSIITIPWSLNLF